MRRVALLLLLVSLVVLAAGCGKDDTPPAEKWADRVCSAVLDWRTSLLDIENVGAGGGVGGFRDKIAAADEATKRLADDLEQAGSPKTEAGEQVKAEVAALGARTERRVERIKAQADALPDNDLAAFARGVVAVAGQMQLALADFQASFAKLGALDPKGELEAALDKVESCRELQRAVEAG